MSIWSLLEPIFADNPEALKEEIEEHKRLKAFFKPMIINDNSISQKIEQHLQVIRLTMKKKLTA